MKSVFWIVVLYVCETLAYEWVRYTDNDDLVLEDVSWVTARSVVECGIFCTTPCNAFSFTRQQRQCYLYTDFSTQGSMNITRTLPKAIFYIQLADISSLTPMPTQTPPLNITEFTPPISSSTQHVSSSREATSTMPLPTQVIDPDPITEEIALPPTQAATSSTDDTTPMLVPTPDPTLAPVTQATSVEETTDATSVGDNVTQTSVLPSALSTALSTVTPTSASGNVMPQQDNCPSTPVFQAIHIPLGGGTLQIMVNTNEVLREDAAHACSILNATLVKIDTVDKQIRLKNHLMHCLNLGGFDYWIGGQKRAPADSIQINWIFHDDTLMPMTSDFWDEGKPSQNPSDKSCVLMSQDALYKWNNHFCDMSLGYICEK